MSRKPKVVNDMQFGVNCQNLLRNDYGPADARCRVYIDRHKTGQWEWLNRATPVPLRQAADILGVTEDQLLEEAKSGQREYDFPSNVSRRVRLGGGEERRTLTERRAAEKLGISIEQLRERVRSGLIEAHFLPEHMRIVLQTKWDYERCPLFQYGGICLYFRPHDGPKIKCLRDAFASGRNPVSGQLF